MLERRIERVNRVSMILRPSLTFPVTTGDVVDEQHARHGRRFAAALSAGRS